MTDPSVPHSCPGTFQGGVVPFEDAVPTLLEPTELQPEDSCVVRLPVPEVPGYEIRELLGHGGMGVVFRAHHRQLDRPVALKMIRDGLLATPAHVVRFQAEARAVARLQHPQIVQIFEIGEHQGRPYFALELVEGGTLAQRLSQAPMEPRQAADLIELLARAIHHAHQQGIIHRDLKPANILLTSDGAPKIADFGLAKELEAEMLFSHGSRDTLLGTPSYMAPEQAWGPPEAVGPSADIYSLGAILYECLTGKPTFQAGALFEVLDHLRHRDPIPPRRLNPLVPYDLQTICLKCLGKMPAHRYASAEELAEDLARFRRREPIHARPVSFFERAWKWICRRPALTLVTTLLLVTLTLGAWGAWYANHWARAQQQAARADLQRERYPALLQQAQQAIAQQRLGQARRILDECPEDVRGWEWNLLSDLANGHVPPRLGHLRQPVQALAFDPLRGHLYAATDQGVRAWDQGSLEELPILSTAGRVRGLTVSPDGRYLAALVVPAPQPTPARLLLPLPLNWFSLVPAASRYSSSLRALPALLGLLPMQPFAVPEEMTAPRSDTAPASPPAPPVSVIAPAIGVVLPARPEEVLVWDLATRQLILRWAAPSGQGYSTPTRLAFHPNGEQLAVLGSVSAVFRPGVPTSSRSEPVNDRYACRAEIAVPRVPEQPFPLLPMSTVSLFDLSRLKRAPRIIRVGGDECHSLVYTRDGTLLALGSSPGLIRLLDPSTGTMRGELRGPDGGTVVSLALDRDGVHLAAGTADGRVDLWNLQTGELLHMLQGHAGAVAELHFDPGSARIYSLGQDGYFKVWRTVSGQSLLTTRVAPAPYSAAMSRSGASPIIAIANSTEGGLNHGITLLGSRSQGKPEPWQGRPAEPLGVAQRCGPRAVPVCPADPLPIQGEPAQPPQIPEPVDGNGGGAAQAPPEPAVQSEQPATAVP